MVVTVTITSMTNFMNGIHIIKKDRKSITNNGIRISGRQLGKTWFCSLIHITNPK